MRVVSRTLLYRFLSLMKVSFARVIAADFLCPRTVAVSRSCVRCSPRHARVSHVFLPFSIKGSAALLLAVFSRRCPLSFATGVERFPASTPAPRSYVTDPACDSLARILSCFFPIWGTERLYWLCTRLHFCFVFPYRFS